MSRFTYTYSSELQEKMMRKSKKVISALISILATLMIPMSAASAAEAWPNEGGHWIYGNNNRIQAYSNYYHAEKCHGSTVTSDNKTSHSIDTAPGKWTDQHIWWYSGQPRFYYRVC